MSKQSAAEIGMALATGRVDHRRVDAGAERDILIWPMPSWTSACAASWSTEFWLRPDSGRNDQVIFEWAGADVDGQIGTIITASW